MHIDISCHNTTLTEGMREAVHEKLSKIDEYTEHKIEAKVFLSVEKNLQKAEAKLFINGDVFVASSTDSSIYSALDSLVPKLRRMMRRKKTKEIQSIRNTKETIRTHLIT